MGKRSDCRRKGKGKMRQFKKLGMSEPERHTKGSSGDASVSKNYKMVGVMASKRAHIILICSRFQVSRAFLRQTIARSWKQVWSEAQERRRKRSSRLENDKQQQQQQRERRWEQPTVLFIGCQTERVAQGQVFSQIYCNRCFQYIAMFP